MPKDGETIALPVALHFKDGVEEWVKGFANLDANAILAQAAGGDFTGKHRTVLVGPAAQAHHRRSISDCRPVT